MPTRIGPRLTAAVADRKVTKEEAEQLVAEAKAEAKWTPAHKAELQGFVAKHGARMDPQAKAALEQFLASQPVRADLKDPLVLKEHRTDVTWKPVGVDAKLYVDDVSADDVLQGSIGDCYLAAGISSLAAADPNLVKNAIKDNGDGTFSVRFYEGVGEGGRPKAVFVNVDSDVAAGSYGGAKYASARDKNELWPGLLEKAYAKWKGGYERIGNGGNASDLFEAVSGKASNWGDVRDFKADTLFKKIQTTTASHKPVAAGTWGDSSPNANFSGTGVHGDHFYTVLGAGEENGQKYVTLRNPWGESEGGNDGKDDGIFKLPFNDFLKLYENIEFGG